MSNNFLGTTALVGVAFCVGSYAHAGAPTESEKDTKKSPESKIELQISGKSSFNMIFGTQTQKTLSIYPLGDLVTAPEAPVMRNQSNMFTVDGSRIEFAAIGKTEVVRPLEFSLRIAVTGDTNTKYSVRENYLSFKSETGTLLLGNTAGVEDRMSFGARDTQVGTGGIDGNFNRMVYTPYGITTSVEQGYYGDTGDATKISYLTPRWEGVQAGISYIPDGKHEGEAKLTTGMDPEAVMPTPFERAAVAAGINYVQSFNDDLQLSLSLTGRTGKVRPERPFAAPNQSLLRYSTKVWAVGGVLEYKGLQLGLQYVCNGNSAQFVANRQAVNPGQPGLPNMDYVASQARAADVFDVGLGYTHGKMQYSVGWLTSSRKTGFAGYKATANVVAAGVQYTITDGFVGYIEGANFNLKNPASPYEMRLTAQSLTRTAAALIGGNVGRTQRASALIAGTKVKF